MKKNFLKKLSFAMAAALVLTSVAPSGLASAATAPKLNATAKTLNVQGKSYDFNVLNAAKGSKIAYSTSNKAVVTVSSLGVAKAKSKGTATITAKVTPKTGKVVTLKAKVKANDYAKTVAIVAPKADKYVAGTQYDFGVTVVNKSGAKGVKKSSSTFAYSVEPVAPATAADVTIKNAATGIITFNKAGEYKVTVTADKSAAKTSSTTIKVVNELKDAKQYDTSSFTVVFAAPVTKADLEAGLKVQYKIGDVALNEQKIKSVTVADDGLSAKVVIYDTFVPGTTYVVSYDVVTKSFVAATTKVEDVTKIEIATTKVTTAVSTKIDVNLYNKDGVIINTSDLEGRLSFESDNNLASLVGNEITLFNDGDHANVTATYHFWTYSDNGTENVLKDTKTIVAGKAVETTASSVAAWTIVKIGETPDYSKVNTLLAVGDTSRLFVKLATTSTSTTYSSNDAAYTSNFKFNSSDTSVLFVDNAGYLIATKTGVVTVTVQYNDVYVGSFQVEVKAARQVSSVAIDNPTINVSNGKFINGTGTDVGTYAKIVTATAVLKDQYGKDFDYNKNFQIDPLGNANPVGFAATINPSTGVISFNASKATKGTYSYLVFDSNYPNLKRTLTINVQEPNSAATSYKIEFSGDYKDGQADVTVDKDDYEKSVGISLVGYAQNGVAVTMEDVKTAGAFAVTVTGPTGTNAATLTASGSSTTATAVYDTAWVSGGAQIAQLAAGNYTVEVKNNTNGKVVARAIFTVVNDQVAPSLKVVQFKTSLNGSAGFEECFKFYYSDGTEAVPTTWGVERYAYTPNKAYVKNAVIKVNLDGTHYVNVTVPVGYYVDVPVTFVY